MIPTGFWRFLHLLFAFSYVGALVLAEWNGRIARGTSSWEGRALLFGVCRRAAGFVAAPGLLLTGVMGNLLAIPLDYRMATDRWMHVANGLWLASVVVLFALSLPLSGKLERIAAAGGGPEWNATLSRWRLGNALLSLLFVALLGVMVFRWKS